MAISADARRFTALHQLLQRRIGGNTVRRLDQLWRLLDTDKALTEDEWATAVLVVLNDAHGVSAEVARRYYQGVRAAELRTFELVREFGVVSLREEAAKAAIASQLVRLRDLVRKGVDPFEAGRRVGAAQSRELVEYVLDGGRDTVINTVQRDDRAVGWYRVTDGDPCAFCALLASRGAVYKSQRSASFGSHPSCGCTAEPAFTADKFRNTQSEQWNDLYRRSTRGHRDKLNSFRRAYERPHLHS